MGVAIGLGLLLALIGLVGGVIYAVVVNYWYIILAVVALIIAGVIWYFVSNHKDKERTKAKFRRTDMVNDIANKLAGGIHNRIDKLIHDSYSAAKTGPEVLQSKYSFSLDKGREKYTGIKIDGYSYINFRDIELRDLGVSEGEALFEVLVELVNKKLNAHQFDGVKIDKNVSYSQTTYSITCTVSNRNYQKPVYRDWFEDEKKSPAPVVNKPNTPIANQSQEQKAYLRREATGHIYELSLSKPITLGTSGCDILGGYAEKHIRIRKCGKRWELSHISEEYGKCQLPHVRALVNGTDVTKGDQIFRELHSGDKIVLTDGKSTGVYTFIIK